MKKTAKTLLFLLLSSCISESIEEVNYSRSSTTNESIGSKLKHSESLLSLSSFLSSSVSNRSNRLSFTSVGTTGSMISCKAFDPKEVTEMDKVLSKSREGTYIKEHYDSVLMDDKEELGSTHSALKMLELSNTKWMFIGFKTTDEGEEATARETHFHERLSTRSFSYRADHDTLFKKIKSTVTVYEKNNPEEYEWNNRLKFFPRKVVSETSERKGFLTGGVSMKMIMPGFEEVYDQIEQEFKLTQIFLFKIKREEAKIPQEVVLKLVNKNNGDVIFLKSVENWEDKNKAEFTFNFYRNRLNDLYKKKISSRKSFGLPKLKIKSLKSSKKKKEDTFDVNSPSIEYNSDSDTEIDTRRNSITSTATSTSTSTRSSVRLETTM